MRRFTFSGCVLVAALVLGMATVAQGDLVSFWNFDEASGPALDSADGNNGTLGSQVTRVTGAIGSGALNFNNTNGAVVNTGLGTGGNYNVTTGMTIEALVKMPTAWALPDASGNHADYIVSKADGLGFGFQKDNFTSGGFPGQALVLSLGFFYDAGSYEELDMPLDGENGRPALEEIWDGNFHHLVGTYDSASGVKSLYVDGTLRISNNIGAGSLIFLNWSASNPLNIGDAVVAGYEPFDGIIDEVGFYSSGLSASEVALHYQQFQAGESYMVPEPSAVVLLITGVLGLLAYAWRKRK